MNTGDFDSTPAPWERSSLALPQSSTELRELQESQPELGEKVQDIIKTLSDLILDFWPERPLQACEPMFKLLAAEVRANINFRLRCGQTQPETSVQVNNQLTKPISTETKPISTETKPRSTKTKRRSPSLDFLWNSKHWSSLLQEVSSLVLDTTDKNDIEELYKLLLQNLQPHQSQCVIRVKPDPLHIKEVAHSVYKDLCVIHPDTWLRYMAYMDPTCVGTQITECIIKWLEIPQQIQSIQKPETPEVSSEDSVTSSGAGFMLDQWRDLLHEVSSRVLATKNVTQIEQFSEVLLPHLLKQNSHRVNQVMPERSDFVAIAKRVHKDLCCTRPKSLVPKLAYADPDYCSQIVDCIFKQIEMQTKKPISTETKPISTETKPISTETKPISTETKPRSTSQTAKEMPTPVVKLPTAVNMQISPQRWVEATAAVKNILEQMGLEILMEEQDSEPENNQETKTSPKPETMDSKLMLVYETALEMRAAQRKREQNCRTTAKPERPDQRAQTAAAPTSKRTTESQEQTTLSKARPVERQQEATSKDRRSSSLDFLWNSKHWSSLLQEVSSLVLDTTDENDIEELYKLLLQNLQPHQSQCVIRVKPDPLHIKEVAHSVYKDLCVIHPDTWLRYMAYMDPTCVGTQITDCIIKRLEIPQQIQSIQKAETLEVSSEDSVTSSGAGFMLDQWRDLLCEVSSRVLATKNVTQIEQFSQILLPHLLKQNSHRLNRVMPKRSDFVAIAKRVHKELCRTRPKSLVPMLAYADASYCSQIVECVFREIEMPSKKRTFHSVFRSMGRTLSRWR